MAETNNLVKAGMAALCSGGGGTATIGGSIVGTGGGEGKVEGGVAACGGYPTWYGGGSSSGDASIELGGEATGEQLFSSRSRNMVAWKLAYFMVVVQNVSAHLNNLMLAVLAARSRLMAAELWRHGEAVGRAGELLAAMTMTVAKSEKKEALTVTKCFPCGRMHLFGASVAAALLPILPSNTAVGVERIHYEEMYANAM